MVRRKASPPLVHGEQLGGKVLVGIPHEKPALPRGVVGSGYLHAVKLLLEKGIQRHLHDAASRGFAADDLEIGDRAPFTTSTPLASRNT